MTAAATPGLAAASVGITQPPSVLEERIHYQTTDGSSGGINPGAGDGIRSAGRQLYNPQLRIQAVLADGAMKAVW